MRNLPASTRPVFVPLFYWMAAAALVTAAGCQGAPSANRPAGKTAASKSSHDVVSDAPVLPPSADQFVGSAACATCHAKETNDFHGHPMSISLVPATQESPLEDYSQSSFSSLPGVTYYAEKTPAGIFHHEKRVDGDGELIYDQAIPIDYTVGSGARGRSYLINHEGLLFVSAMSWYANTGKWDLSPGYGPHSHPRFERRASEGCLACHAGRSVVRENEPNRFAEAPFLEHSIGCERCHGPGKAHVAFRSKPVAPSAVDPMVNPASLVGAKRDAICNQCHLQGRRRVVRHGRTEFDFTPGMNLSDVWITYVKTEGVTDGVAAAVSQVEQMYASKCYRESDGQLSCIRCHDGHDTRKGDQVDRGFREKCMACHSPGKNVECSETLATRTATTSVDSCIVCHMPKLPAADVHAAQTDHRLLRRIPQDSPANAKHPSPMRERTPVLFVEPGVKVPANAIARARGIFLAEQSRSAAGSKSDAREAINLLIATIQAEPNDIEALYSLGMAFGQIQQNELMVQAWMKVVQLQPEHENALESLAIHFHEINDMPNARKYYEAVLKVNPYRSQYYGRLAHVLGQLDELQLGIETAEKCLELNPSLQQTHAWLEEAFRRTGDTERMQFHAHMVERFKSVYNQPRPPAK